MTNVKLWDALRCWTGSVPISIGAAALFPTSTGALVVAGRRRYRIKSLIEPHERVVSEIELSEAPVCGMCLFHFLMPPTRGSQFESGAVFHTGILRTNDRAACYRWAGLLTIRQKSCSGENLFRNGALSLIGSSSPISSTWGRHPGRL